MPAATGRFQFAWLGVATAAMLAGCASGPSGLTGTRDGAPSRPPADLAQLPDAEPRIETVRSNGGTSKPYTVEGRAYTPLTDDQPFREAGLASWYGTGFHGRSTASGEPYDMYAMTAAHRTLPLPSYARVLNPANGREVIVRVNDRGPFHDGRVVDLSYAAATRLDLLRGVAPVIVERITNEDIRTGAWRRDKGTQLAAAPSQPAPAGDRGPAVPATWAMPVSYQPGAPTAAPARPIVQQLAQATPANSTLEPIDSAPPPRFRGMEATDLPPLAPAPAASGTAGVPTAPSAVPPSGRPAPSAVPAPGFWVQLGAFREREGAQALQARTTGALPSVGPQLRVFSEGSTHRLQAGPFASRAEANGTVNALREAMRLSPIVVERR